MGNPFILAEFPHQVWRDLFLKKGFLSPSVRKSFYSGSVPHTRPGWSLSTEKDFLSPGVRGSFYSGRVPTPGVDRSLYKQEDFLSPGVRNSFYSGRVPHTWCGGVSLETRGLSFTRCEGILLFWQSSHTHTWCKEISFYIESFPFTMHIVVSFKKKKRSFLSPRSTHFFCPA